MEEADEKPQAYRTHPAILANLPLRAAGQSPEQQQQRQRPEPSRRQADDGFERLLEEHLEADERVELAYRLNEYETNACDLSELLSYLMQSLLIKLPSLMIKYKLLSYIKQLYVEPKLCAEDPSESQLDLRLFEATIRRYLLASHQPLLSSPPTELAESEAAAELRRRRRQRRAAALRNQLFAPIDYRRSGSSSPAEPRALRRPQDDRLLALGPPGAPDAADTCGLMETETRRPYRSHLSWLAGGPSAALSLDALNQRRPPFAWPEAYQALPAYSSARRLCPEMDEAADDDDIDNELGPRWPPALAQRYHHNGLLEHEEEAEEEPNLDHPNDRRRQSPSTATSGVGGRLNGNPLNEFSAPWTLALEPLEPLDTLDTLEGLGTPPGGRLAPATAPCGVDNHCGCPDSSPGAPLPRPGPLGTARCPCGARHQLSRCCSLPSEAREHPAPLWPAQELPPPPPPRPFRRAGMGDQRPPQPGPWWPQQPQHWPLVSHHNNHNQAHKRYGPARLGAPFWAPNTNPANVGWPTSASLPSSPIADDKLGATSTTNWPVQRHSDRHQRHRRHNRRNQHRQNSADLWQTPPANQLKDYGALRMDPVAVGGYEEADEETEQAGVAQEEPEEAEEEEEEVLMVPSQARGRLRMSVAEQMKEQANNFVRNSGKSTEPARHQQRTRQRPQLQVRRTLKVKIKKSKPILGIAIEGGFNVSGQLLPRIVCVHEEGAAYQCGKLRASDLILEVNGHSTVNMTHDQIAKTIANAYYQDPRPYIEFLIGESLASTFYYPFHRVG